MIKNIKKNDYSTSNYEKNDVYCLGLVGLEMATFGYI